MARNLPCEREVVPCCDLSSDIRGGFSRGVPPLPIPNRAVKPARADGTDTPVGRVGRRRTSGSPDIDKMSGLLFLYAADGSAAACLERARSSCMIGPLYSLKLCMVILVEGECPYLCSILS